MQSNDDSRGSIARKVSVTGCIVLAGVLAAICAVMSVMAMQGSRERIVTWVGDKAASVSDLADALDATSRASAERMFGVFKQDFDSTFTHDEASGDLGNFGASLRDNFTAVDKFSQVTGGVATVFSHWNGDFVGITTSLKKENGELRRANEILKTASAFFAQAELDRRLR